MRYRRISVISQLLIFISMIVQFHHHDAHGCPTIAVNTSLELTFCDHNECHHSIPDSHQECSLSGSAFVYTCNDNDNFIVSYGSGLSPAPGRDIGIEPLLSYSCIILGNAAESSYLLKTLKRYSRRGPPMVMRA